MLWWWVINSFIMNWLSIVSTWIISSHPHSLLTGELLMELDRVESTAGPVIVGVLVVLITGGGVLKLLEKLLIFLLFSVVCYCIYKFLGFHHIPNLLSYVCNGVSVWVMDVFFLYEFIDVNIIMMFIPLHLFNIWVWGLRSRSQAWWPVRSHPT